ncbi:unnamed protein product [Cuscuta campestris]|uniref:Uncharacterized protein n=1 Tax=Cuscuta campestris TaxID=132261 RepID=A0A484KLJ0_9ASTE|nr:unnamed protein product [Cuscuta campestris]
MFSIFIQVQCMLLKLRIYLVPLSLLDLYVEKMRYAAVSCMSRSYRPTVPVSYIALVLGFTSVGPTTEGSDEDTYGMEECVEWLKAHGACLTSEDSGEIHFDTKASISSLFIPEPEDAVAHGDASLAVSDFMTRNLGELKFSNA